MKIFPLLIAATIFGFTTPAWADETLTIPQDFALTRVVKLEVTPLGVAIALPAPIESIKLTHMRDIAFSTLDGVLCESQNNCPDGTSPTMLLLRKIKPIDFKDQPPSSDGTTMLFVLTSRGLYRFQLKPVQKQPDYTKVEFKNPPNYNLGKN